MPGPDPQGLLGLLVATREVERDRIAQAADTWAKAAAELNRIADGLDPHQGESFRHSWRGRAADAATAAFDQIAANARRHAAEYQAVADALRAGDAAVEKLSDAVFTEIGTKLQAKKRGGLFGGIADWVEDTFDDQPDVDRDEQIQRIHATYGEFIGAMQTHSHAVGDVCPAASDGSEDAQRYGEVREMAPVRVEDLATPGGSSTKATLGASDHGQVGTAARTANAQWAPASIQEPDTSTAPAALSPGVSIGEPAIQTTDSPNFGLLAGGAGALGAAGLAARAAYGLARGRVNVPGAAGPVPTGIGGSPSVSGARATPALGGTPIIPGPAATTPATGPGARAGAPGPAAGMVGAVGGSPGSSTTAKGPATRYGPAPQLADDPTRGHRRKRADARDVLGPGSRHDPPPAREPVDEQDTDDDA